MQFDLVADGLQFPEGPVVMQDGSVLVVEMKRQTLTRVMTDGSKQQVAHLGGGPNGAAIGPDGAVYICNSGGNLWPKRTDGMDLPHGTPPDYTSGSIQRVDLTTRVVTTLYTHCDGKKLNSPNDIVFDSNGAFWFTDLGRMTEEHVADQGVLYYAYPDGSRIVRAREYLITPNGVGLSPDGKTVYVAETLTGRVWAFAIAYPGALTGGTGNLFEAQPLLGPVSGYELFDSLAVEENGRVCVASLVKGGITCFDLNGSYEYFAAPDRFITNICFGGVDMQDAWITSSGTGKLYRARWPRRGLRLEFNG
jgi:gluconolactonase